jgi:hypothetical protein
MTHPAERPDSVPFADLQACYAAATALQAERDALRQTIEALADELSSDPDEYAYDIAADLRARVAAVPRA